MMVEAFKFDMAGTVILYWLDAICRIAFSLFVYKLFEVVSHSKHQ
jgi:hypothetical protein